MPFHLIVTENDPNKHESTDVRRDLVTVGVPSNVFSASTMQRRGHPFRPRPQHCNKGITEPISPLLRCAAETSDLHHPFRTCQTIQQVIDSATNPAGTSGLETFEKIEGSAFGVDVKPAGIASGHACILKMEKEYSQFALMKRP